MSLIPIYLKQSKIFLYKNKGTPLPMRLYLILWVVVYTHR